MGQRAKHMAGDGRGANLGAKRETRMGKIQKV